MVNAMVTYLLGGSLLLSSGGLLGSSSLLGSGSLLLGLGGGSGGGLLGGSSLLSGGSLLRSSLLLGSGGLLLLLGLGLLLSQLGASGRTLRLLEDTLLNTGLQGLVEQRVEHVVRDVQGVVGLDVLLEGLTAGLVVSMVM